MFIMGVSYLSNVVVSIYRIFIGTLLKCHGTSNSTTKNVMHWPRIVSSEWGQHWNFFNMCLYASKFDMVSLDTCLDGMGGFQNSRMYDVIQKHFEKISTLAPIHWLAALVKSLYEGPWGSNLWPPWAVESSCRSSYQPSYLVVLNHIWRHIYLSLHGGLFGGEKGWA